MCTIDMSYIMLDIAEKNISELCKYKKIDKIPYIEFKKEIDGLEKISDKEYKLHIKTGSDILVLVNGSKLLIKNSDYHTGRYAIIKNIEIVSLSQSIIRIPLIKFNISYNNGDLYLITDYYKLSTNDIIKINFENEIKEPEFIFLNILRLYI